MDVILRCYRTYYDGEEDRDTEFHLIPSIMVATHESNTYGESSIEFNISFLFFGLSLVFDL